MAKTRRISKSTKRRLRVFGILSLVCILYFIFCLGFELYKVHELKLEEKQLKEEYESLKKEAEELIEKVNKAIEKEIDELNDPEYLAKYARENYLYSKDGEYIIKLNDKDEEIKKVNNEINGNYIIVGLSIFIIIIFLYVIIRSKKNK